MKIEQNDLILSIKGCVKTIEQEHSSTMLMKQCLSTIRLITFGQVARQLKSCVKLSLCRKKVVVVKNVVRSWLAKQPLWQVHIPPLEEINHPHYDVTKPIEQLQFNLLYVPHNVFEGNIYRYIV